MPYFTLETVSDFLSADFMTSLYKDDYCNELPPAYYSTTREGIILALHFALGSVLGIVYSVPETNMFPDSRTSERRYRPQWRGTEFLGLLNGPLCLI